MKKSLIIIVLLITVLVVTPTAQAVFSGPSWLFFYPIKGFAQGDFIKFVLCSQGAFFWATGLLVLNGVGYPITGAGYIFGTELVMFLFAGTWFLDLRINLLNALATMFIIVMATGIKYKTINLSGLQVSEAK